MKNMEIVLKGQPLSTNHCYYHAGKGLTFIKPNAKALKEDYRWQAKAQWKSKPLSEPLSITIKLFMGTRRKVDWDNYHKLSMDALNGLVWLDDSQVMVARVEKLYDKLNPRIEIEINVLQTNETR